MVSTGICGTAPVSAIEEKIRRKVHTPWRRARESEAPAATAGPRDYPLARIRSGTVQPWDAYAAIRYRDHWFWIDDRDLAAARKS